MIHRLYNPWQITNPGEKEADKQLAVPGQSDELMYVIHSLRLSRRYHRTQMAGECDFVVLTRDGIMIIEVKGGLIGYGVRNDDTTGYYRLINRNREPLGNPFTQVDENADAIQKYLADKGYRNIFVGKMVCFPECPFNMHGIGEDDLWHRDHEMTLADMIIDSLQVQKEDFHEKERERGSARYTAWHELEEEDMSVICRALEPEFSADQCRSLLKLNLVESDRQKNEGINLLRGLDENKRLMVQGPPGSGKSSYALSVITRLCRKEGKTGLYLCWNELLAAEMRKRISDPELELPDGKISVKLFFDLAKEMGELSGDKTLVPTMETVAKGELRTCIKGAVTKISKKIQRYDFIVVDEAQDIFDKGIDNVLKALLKVNNPLQNGSYYIFYDDSQDYPDSGDLGHYIRTRDTLKSYSATYNLVSNLRINTGHGITELISDAASGNINTGKEYGEDVIIKQWNNPANVLALIKRAIIKETGVNCLKQQNILVLFTSDLLKDGSPVQAAISANPDYELLKSGAYNTNTDKIRYTTMLKAKGLECDAVILVCHQVTGKNAFQIFIGASRARCRVHLFYG